MCPRLKRSRPKDVKCGHFTLGTMANKNRTLSGPFAPE
jgi:hypothetical protein